MITFDDLVLNGSTVFDDLNRGAIASDTQQGDVTLVLSGEAVQDTVGAYDQNVDIDLVLESTGLQEFLAPSGAPAYLQSGNVQLVSFSFAGQEHIAVAGGEWGQSANVTLLLVLLTTQQYLQADVQNVDVYITFQANSTQEHIEAIGGAITEQDGSVSLTFQGYSLHDWEDSYTGPQAFASQPLVVGISEGTTPFPLAILPALTEIPAFFYLKFTSAAAEWRNNSGKAGAPVGAELLLNGVPFVSVTPEQDDVYIQSHIEPQFTQLFNALFTGEADIKARSFERFPTHTLNQPLHGTSTLRLRAYF